MNRRLAIFTLLVSIGAFAAPRVVLFEEFTNTS